MKPGFKRWTTVEKVLPSLARKLKSIWYVIHIVSSYYINLPMNNANFVMHLFHSCLTFWYFVLGWLQCESTASKQFKNWMYVHYIWWKVVWPMASTNSRCCCGEGKGSRAAKSRKHHSTNTGYVAIYGSYAWAARQWDIELHLPEHDCQVHLWPLGGILHYAR